MAANEIQLPEADDNNNSGTSSRNAETSTLTEKPKKPAAEAFEVDFCGSGTGKAATSLQEAFERFRKQRQDNIREQRRQLRQQDDVKRDPAQMEELRHKFVEQCKEYFGVPYARKYWAPDTPEYNSPVFLDCCGLVRRVLRDLHHEFGFRVGPWNQAYMFDTLPLVLAESEMRPGDLVFMTGKYVNPKSKKQRHDMLHVEVWLGEGPKTIGARWNNGKVQVFESYQFSPKSFTDERYLFRSIDTWLQGTCKSHCDLHPWGKVTQEPGRKSIFFLQEELGEEDQGAGDDDDDDVDEDYDVTVVVDDVTGHDDETAGERMHAAGPAAETSETQVPPPAARVGGSSGPVKMAEAFRGGESSVCCDVGNPPADVSVTSSSSSFTPPSPAPVPPVAAPAAVASAAPVADAPVSDAPVADAPVTPDAPVAAPVAVVTSCSDVDIASGDVDITVAAVPGDVKTVDDDRSSDVITTSAENDDSST